MFLEDRIKGIKEGDLVLEVGPGGSPHPRADVLLERSFASDDEKLAQRGYSPPLITTKPQIFYDGSTFPFSDRQFDYVICSHVIEHVPQAEMAGFLSELSRVAPRGYIEFPNALYEFINHQDVHKWYMALDGDKIQALSKDSVRYPPVAKVFRTMFYANGNEFPQIFQHYRDIFFCGYEWEDAIRFEEVASLDDLYNENKLYELIQDIEQRPSCFAPALPPTGGLVGMRLRKLKTGLLSISRRARARARRLMSSKSEPKVHRSAVLADRKLIRLADGCEVKEGVIINTYHNPVCIGKNSQINPYTVIYGGSGVQIGDNVMIAPHCVIAAGNHDYRQTELPMRFAGTLTRGPIVIEDDVWVGANSTIADGVTIGTGAVIGANSLVNRNVQPFDIVVGVPARTVSNRKKGK